MVEAPASNAVELQMDLQTRAESGDIGMDAILFITEPLSVTADAFAVCAKFAADHNIPLGGSPLVTKDYASIFSLTVDLKTAGGQAASLADKILKGTPAGTIPVVSAENYLRINYKMARKLNLRVPESLLSMADEIIR